MFWAKGNMNLACVSIPEEVSSEAQWREVLQKHLSAGCPALYCKVLCRYASGQHITFCDTWPVVFS